MADLKTKKILLQNKIMALVLRGYTQKEISETLQISPSAVQKHMSEIRQLQLNRTELIENYKKYNISRLEDIYAALLPFAMGEHELTGGVPSTSHVKELINIIKLIDSMLPDVSSDRDNSSITITIENNSDLYKAALEHMAPSELLKVVTAESQPKAILHGQE